MRSMKHVNTGDDRIENLLGEVEDAGHAGNGVQQLRRVRHVIDQRERGRSRWDDSSGPMDPLESRQSGFDGCCRRQL